MIVSLTSLPKLKKKKKTHTQVDNQSQQGCGKLENNQEIVFGKSFQKKEKCQNIILKQAEECILQINYIEGDKNKQKLFNGRGAMELQRVRHNWTEHTHTHSKID